MDMNLMADYEKKYDIAADNCRVDEMLNIYCKAMDNMGAKAFDASKDGFWRHKITLPFWGVWQALLNHDGVRALELIEYLPLAPEAATGINYYYGLAYYELQQWEKSRDHLLLHLKNFRWEKDELAMFYLGNVYSILGNNKVAIDWYNRALNIRKSFNECKINKELVKNDKQINYLYPWKSYLNMGKLSFHELPIFINSRDRVDVLSDLIDWLWSHGYTNVYIIDNDSTYAPLLKYYNEIDRKKARVIYLRANFGHDALWTSGLLEKLNISTPYIYTDSDILPEDTCPDDIIQLFYEILEYCPFLRKVGFALKTDDVSYSSSESIIKGDFVHYQIQILPNAYLAGIDTTFALYGNHRMYTVDQGVRVRIPGALARHTPWYYGDNIPEDEKYYIEHASASSTYAEWYKQRKICDIIN